ncbi:MAG: DUF5320 domain-containing protein [Sedimentisphaerales bacterium]|nr:DUF5320 domain-containing protein [Sedimentisphaerales bacterium]
MPGGDGTGPMGMGPMTGRAAGYCGGYVMPGYANYGMGRGFIGRGGGFGGRGGGRGWRNWYYATGLPGWARFSGYPSGFSAAPTAEQEHQALKQQAQYLADSLDMINKRIEELQKSKTD